MSRPAPTPEPDADAVLSRALEAWRADCASARPADRLAERVLAAAARGDAESSRFRRLARVYAVAASVLAAAGVTGALLARRAAPVVAAARAPSVADLEEARLSVVSIDSVADLAVGGR